MKKNSDMKKVTLEVTLLLHVTEIGFSLGDY